MPSPGFTLTATLQTIAGTAAGSVSNPAKLSIKLVGYGLTLPCIAGTSTLAQTKYEILTESGSLASLPIYGNDQIAPAGTWYSISLIDGRGNIVQTTDYWLTGAGGDLSSLLPKAAGYLVGAAPNGQLPGYGFALPVAMVQGGAAGAAFWYGGRLQDQRGYQLSSQGLQTGFPVQPNDSLWVSYVTAAAVVGLPMKFWTAIANGVFPGTAYTLPTAPPGASLIGIFYAGGFLRPTAASQGGGPDYSLAGQNLTLAFETDPPDLTTGLPPALVGLYAVGTAPVTIEELTGAYPGSVYNLSAPPLAGQLIALFYNPLFQRPLIDYTLAGTVATLNFATQTGDSVYAAYIPT